MKHLRLIHRGLFGVGFLALNSCATLDTWQNLPPMRDHVFVKIAPNDAATQRFKDKIEHIVQSRPLPVDAVAVTSTTYLRTLGRQLDPAMELNAAAVRCGPGNPPRYGCLIIGSSLFIALSNDAIAGIFAHELGHLEAGHKGTESLELARNAQGLGQSLYASYLTGLAFGSARQ